MRLSVYSQLLLQLSVFPLACSCRVTKVFFFCFLRMKQTKWYSLEEVKQHNTKGDYWVVIDGGVYDISRWAPYHPGGELPIRYMAGRECSDVFKAFHKSSIIEKKLPAFKIGEVKDDCMASIKGSSLDQDYRRLREEVEGCLDTDCKLIFCLCGRPLNSF